MPRHDKKGDDFDFAIHEDPPAPMDESDVRDFADKLSSIGDDDSRLSKGDETLLDHEMDDRIPVEATDSNMTKASTLVDGQTDEPEPTKAKTESVDDVESKIDSMLEELQDKDVLEEKADSEVSLSRRESVATTGTHDDETESSCSRRDSGALTAETHDLGTEGSSSRRHSAISTGTYESSRRGSGSGWSDNDSLRDHEAEDETRTVDGDDDEDYTQASGSRRESMLSSATGEFHRRASGRTEALIHAAARDIVEQISNDRSRQSSKAGSRAGHRSVMSDSNSRDASARSSDAHELLAGEDEHISARPSSDAHESLVDEDIEHTSARSSGTHETVLDESIEHTSARSSDAHKSLADHEDVEHMSPRTSDAHESLAGKDVEQDEDIENTSAKLSEAHELLADEDVEHASARPSDAHESLADENIEHSSARPSDAYESLADQDVEHTTARPSDAHKSLADGDDEHMSPRHSDAHESLPDETIEHTSARSSDAHESLMDSDDNHTRGRLSDSRDSLADESIRESIEQEDENLARTEEAADNSSHNENEDDVFSDHSPRSSLGSYSEAEQRKLNNVTQRRSPRVSDFSHYDTDDQDDVFVPTVRGTPRPPFRSPSSVKAIQMSSPPPSVLGSSRSSRRTPLPTVSRLGSPSAQYSPKKTPPRFKRNTPPLVLLHATLLPLRWPWGDVLDHCRAGELSEGGKGVLDAWRQLQDQLGDTVCERGILLPHPQNDFEVLEERLLEALELPLKRRARILECGHYLGPSNDMTAEETDSEDDFHYEDQRSPRGSLDKKTHWCSTCRSEIRYDSLGAGRVFRVKVYASNGLVKAGAWEACWKEMERVDVEVEPIVEPEVHDELVRLDAEQQRAAELSHHDVDDDVMEEEEIEEEHIEDEPEDPEESYLEHETSEIHHMASSPPPEIRVTSSPSPPPVDEHRRRRDEERLREIYGHTPPTHPEPSTEEPPSAEYVDHQTPPPPPAEAFARGEERRQTSRNESLPELLLEALKVMMQDRKNVMIAVMSVLVLVLAIRGGAPSSSGEHNPATWQTVVKGYEAPATVTVTEKAEPARETLQSLASTVEAVMLSAAPSLEASPSEASVSEDPLSETIPSEATPSEAAPSEDPSEEATSPEDSSLEIASSEAALSGAPHYEAIPSEAVPSEAIPSEAPFSEAAPSETPSSASSEVASSEDTETSRAIDPCATGSAVENDGYHPVANEHKTVVSEETILVVQTVTQTSVETAIVVETVTETRTEAAQQTGVEEEEEEVDVVVEESESEPAESTMEDLHAAEEQNIGGEL